VKREKKGSAVTRDPEYTHNQDNNIAGVDKHAVQSLVITRFVGKYQAVPFSLVQSVKNGVDNSDVVSILTEDGH
jgi:hypothetical protein